MYIASGNGQSAFSQYISTLRHSGFYSAISSCCAAAGTWGTCGWASPVTEGLRMATRPRACHSESPCNTRQYGHRSVEPHRLPCQPHYGGGDARACSCRSILGCETESPKQVSPSTCYVDTLLHTTLLSTYSDIGSAVSTVEYQTVCFWGRRLRSPAMTEPCRQGGRFISFDDTSVRLGCDTHPAVRAV